LLGDPLLSALSVALAKSRATQLAEAAEIVVAADTLVVAHAEILGKPPHAQAAREMLGALRDTSHAVVSGVSLRTATHREWGGVVSSHVIMRAYTEAEIETYVARGEPFDKAGGYAVQDAEFQPAARVEGCFLNVVGLPLCAVVAGLEALGQAPESPAPRTAPCEYCARGAALVEIRA
jgi:MAF protein